MNCKITIKRPNGIGLLFLKLLTSGGGEGELVFQNLIIEDEVGQDSIAWSSGFLRGMMLGDTEMRGIPPEAYHLARRYDNGMTHNEFYHNTFAPIKLALGLDDIKMNTLRQFIAQGERTGEKEFFMHAKSFMLSRFDVLTVIAMSWKGVTFAEEFHAKLHSVIELGNELDNYFKERGV